MQRFAVSRRAFTLVELLTVVAIVGILVILTLPAIFAIREAARRTHCQNNLKQLGLALNNHESATRRFPAAAENEWSWVARILPHLEERQVYDRFDFSLDPFVPPNDDYTGAVFPVLQCPSDERSAEVHVALYTLNRQKFGHTSFLGTLGDGASRGMFEPRGGVRLREVIDGASKTLLVGERGVVADGNHTHGWWVWGISGDTYLSARAGLRPGVGDQHSSAYHFWSHHSGGANFVFVDGSVRWLDYDIDPLVFIALGSKDGAESVSLEY